MNINTRLMELDVLRGFAALSVVLYHYTYRFEELYQHSKTTYFLNFNLGYLGVELFFIISGFVIFMTLEKCVDIKDFIFKRITRLYPAYITSVILTSILVGFIGLEGRETKLWEAIFNLTMLQGFFTPFGIVNHVDGVYWSLAVELIFYIAMGVMLVLGVIKKVEIPLVIWLITAYIIGWLYSIDYNNFIIGGLRYYGILSYCNLFIAGIMFYKLRNKNQLYYHLIIVICLAYEFIFNGVVQGIVVTVFFIAFYMVINRKISFINNKPFAFLGTISYSLYLVHQNIGYIIINSLEQNGFNNEIYILVPLTVSIVLATLITYYIEKPLQNKLKNLRNLKNQGAAILKTVS